MKDTVAIAGIYLLVCMLIVISLQRNMEIKQLDSISEHLPDAPQTYTHHDWQALLNSTSTTN